MIDLTQNSLPNTITVSGREYSIYTDFRVWMRFENSLKGCHENDQIEIGYLFKNERPIYSNIRDILAFSRPPRELPRAVRGTSSDAIVIDFEIDGDLIYAAFLQQYGIDLVEIPELHWHKFLALLHGLKGTKLDEIMSYRCYEKQQNKDIDPYEELREAWTIVPPLSQEEEDELEAFNAMLTPPSEK